VRDERSSDAAGDSTSVRTFLIADMRGYTRYSDEHGDEAASTLARRFAAIAGGAVTAQGGEMLELRGDEALCVFVSARSAVRGAVELQRRARERTEGAPALPLGVGIGLDAGEAVETAGGFRGRALNAAARLCSLAKGGEILASETVAHLAGRHDEATYAPRRPTPVKGVAEPIRYVQVLPAVELPPPPPAPPRPSSSPISRTSSRCSRPTSRSTSDGSTRSPARRAGSSIALRNSCASIGPTRTWVAPTSLAKGGYSAQRP